MRSLEPNPNKQIDYQTFKKQTNYMQKQILTIALFILTIVAIISLPFIAQAQTHKAKSIATKPVDTPKVKNDTLYFLKDFKDVQALYTLLQSGLNGVKTSKYFSDNDREQYAKTFAHLDSLLLPQIKKYHPELFKKPGEK